MKALISMSSAVLVAGLCCCVYGMHFCAPRLETPNEADFHLKFIPQLRSDPDMPPTHRLYSDLPNVAVSGNPNQLCQVVPVPNTQPTAVGDCSIQLSGLHYCYGGGENVSGGKLVVTRGESSVSVMLKHLGSPLAEALYWDRDCETLLSWLSDSPSVSASPGFVYDLLSRHYARKGGDDDLHRAVISLVIDSCDTSHDQVSSFDTQQYLPTKNVPACLPKGRT